MFFIQIKVKLDFHSLSVYYLIIIHNVRKKYKTIGSEDLEISISQLGQVRSSLSSSLSPPFILHKMVIAFPAALIHYASYNKNHMEGVDYIQQKCISHRLGKRRWGGLPTKCCRFQCLVRTHILVHRRPSCCCNFSWKKGAGELSVVCPIKHYSQL